MVDTGAAPLAWTCTTAELEAAILSADDRFEKYVCALSSRREELLAASGTRLGLLASELPAAKVRLDVYTCTTLAI